MFKQIDYTMVVVSDMDKSVEFYRDKLGIPLKFQSPSGLSFKLELPRWLCTVEACPRSGRLRGSFETGWCLFNRFQRGKR